MSRPIRVLELRSVRGTGGGPEKTILLGAARPNPSGVRVTVCYIRDARDAEFQIDKRARALGVDYVEVTERHSFDPGIWPQLRRVVREREIEIVHSHDYKTDFLALLLARVAGVVPVTTAHGWTGHSWRERQVYYPAGKRLIRAFSHVIAVSADIRSDLVSAGVSPSRIRVVLNGIDPIAFRRDRSSEAAARIEYGVAPGDVVIGAVGRLEPQKRFDLLIGACALARQRQPNLQLLIAGEGSARAALEQLARGTLPGACRILPQQRDIRQLHHAIDIFVQSSDYEGTSNAVLEGMALETPIVATDAGGTRELIAHGVDGLLTPRGDPAALVAAMSQTLADRPGTARRVAAARARIESELSFDARTRAVEAIYQEIVDGRRGHADAA